MLRVDSLDKSLAHTSALGIIWLVAGFHAAFFFALGVDRYLAHRNLVDFGLFTQVTASAFSSFSSTFEGVTHWAFHFSPILYLCAPFVLLAHSGLALTALQSVAIALALPPVYLIAERRTSPTRALATACVAALYPALAGVGFTDFHENGFAPAATLWLLWAVDARRWGYAYVFLALVLSIKEDQALMAAFVGAIFFSTVLRRKDRPAILFSVVTVVLSVGVFIAYFTIIRPLVDPAHHWQPTRFYAWRMGDLHNVLLPTLGDRLGYIVLAFAPLAFLPLRSRCVVFALPGLAECVLSREHATYTMGQHYAGVWVPYVVAAFAVSVEKLHSMRPLGIAAVLCLLTYLVANPLHPGYFLRVPAARDAQLDAYLMRLPSDIAVGTQEEAYTHLGFHPRAQLGLAGNPEYLLLDRDFTDSVWLGWMERSLRAERKAASYRLIERRGGIELYSRLIRPSFPNRRSRAIRLPSHDGSWKTAFPRRSAL
jgi:uncharacterized membrane protein